MYPTGHLIIVGAISAFLVDVDINFIVNFLNFQTQNTIEIVGQKKKGEV